MNNITINLEFNKETKFNFENIEFNKICLLIGANGTGKTIILVLQWILNMIKYVYLVDNDINKLKAHLQYLLKGSFTDFEATGHIVSEDDNFYIDFRVNKGILVEFNIKLKKQIDISRVPLFLSKNTRTLDQIMQFHLLTKTLGVEFSLEGDEKAFDKLSSLYKIYDIIYMQLTITKFKQGLIFQQNIIESLKNFNLDIIEIYLDDKDKLLYKNSKNEIKPALSLSAGEQSILTMTIANI